MRQLPQTSELRGHGVFPCIYKKYNTRIMDAIPLKKHANTLASARIDHNGAQSTTFWGLSDWAQRSTTLNRYFLNQNFLH